MDDEDLRNKIIITTNRKLELVKKLSDFMSIKGVMLMGRMNPYLLKDVEHQTKIVRFLTSNSEMQSLAFWNRLSEAKRKKIAKVLSIQEVNEDNKKIRLGGSKETAELYICLSGNAVVKIGDEEDKVYGPGQVFGNTEMFEEDPDLEGMLRSHAGSRGGEYEEDDEAYDSFDHNAIQLRSESGQRKRKPPKKKPQRTPVSIATLGKGSYMRMSYADYMKFVIAEEEMEDLEELKRQDEAIAGIAYNQLTQHDFFYITVFKRCKEMLKYDLFEFMNSYHMIPRNSRMLAAKYYNESEVGHVNYIEPEDGLFVFVVINGSIRLEVVPNKHELVNRDHNIGCNRKGDPTLQVATRSMPLMLLQSGSMMWLQEQCFTLGREELRVLIKKAGPEDNTFDNPSLHVNDPKPDANHKHNKGGGRNDKRRGSDSSTHSLMSAVSACSVDGKFPRSRRYYIPKSKPPKSPVKPHKKMSSAPHVWNTDEADDAYLYHIRMTFEQQTTYLAIPIENFDKILDNEELIIPEMAAEIKAQLQHANSSIFTRIQGLLPWIMGNQEFDQAEPKQRVAVEDLEPKKIDFKLEDFMPAAPDLSVVIPQGSFLRPTPYFESVEPNPNVLMMSKSLNALPPMPHRTKTPEGRTKSPIKKLPKGAKGLRIPASPKPVQLRSLSPAGSVKSFHSQMSNKSISSRSMKKDDSFSVGSNSISDADSLGSLMKITSSKSTDHITFVNKMKQKIVRADSFDKKKPLIKVFEDENIP